MIPEQVDSDPEQPRTDISTTRVEGPALRKSHGEGLCGQILGSSCSDLAFEKAVNAAKVTVEDDSEPRRFLERSAKHVPIRRFALGGLDHHLLLVWQEHRVTDVVIVQLKTVRTVGVTLIESQM
jgi:hypothetical protein